MQYPTSMSRPIPMTDDAAGSFIIEVLAKVPAGFPARRKTTRKNVSTLPGWVARHEFRWNITDYLNLVGRKTQMLKHVNTAPLSTKQ